jgi:hypothetical protein
VRRQVANSMNMNTVKNMHNMNMDSMQQRGVKTCRGCAWPLVQPLAHVPIPCQLPALSHPRPSCCPALPRFH